MPHLESAQDLIKYLDLEEIKAKDVQPGDIIWHQGQVLLVADDEPRITGIPERDSTVWLSFGCKVSYDGYELKISARPTDVIRRIKKKQMIKKEFIGQAKAFWKQHQNDDSMTLDRAMKSLPDEVKQAVVFFKKRGLYIPNDSNKIK